MSDPFNTDHQDNSSVYSICDSLLRPSKASKGTITDITDNEDSDDSEYSDLGLSLKEYINRKHLCSKGYEEEDNVDEEEAIDEDQEELVAEDDIGLDEVKDITEEAKYDQPIMARRVASGKTEEEDIIFDRNDKRVALAYYFTRVLGVSSSQNWSGTNGPIHRTMRMFDIENTRNNYGWIYRIFQDVLDSLTEGKLFNDAKIKKKFGRNPVLHINSPEAKILTNTVESGLGLKHALDAINEYRDSVGKDLVRGGCIYGLHTRLNPSVFNVKKRKTGSRDITSPWAQARYNWVRQLLVRFQAIDVRNSVHFPYPLQPCYQLHYLSPVSLNQVAF